MGQYFYPTIGNNFKGEFIPKAWIHPHDYDNGLKFMEFSYTLNPIVCKIMDLIRLPNYVEVDDHPHHRVIWAGDYGPVTENGRNVYSNLWQDYNDRRVKDEAGIKFDFKLKYILNYTKKEWVDCSKVSFSYDTLRVSALAALTATPMGGNGGDFKGVGLEHVGKWSGDFICSTTAKSRIPRSYTQLVVDFHD